jgi:hypothetical protein
VSGGGIAGGHTGAMCRAAASGPWEGSGRGLGVAAAVGHAGVEGRRWAVRRRGSGFCRRRPCGVAFFVYLSLLN